MPDWLKITAVVSCGAVSRVSEALDVFGAIAVTFENATDAPECDESVPIPPQWAFQAVSGLFDIRFDWQPLVASLREITDSETPISTAYFDNQDWVLDGQKQFSPLAITQKLWICPTWDKPPNPNAVNIRIDPGLAFGTGKHPTTALCLGYLADFDLENKFILDWGCGSGILAITALKLGAAIAIGVDIDDRALTISRQNAAINGVGDRLRVYHPELVPSDPPCHLVIANILSRTLLGLAPTLDHHLASNGTLVLSGILDDQVSDITSALSSGYCFNTISTDGWIMVIATRTN